MSLPNFVRNLPGKTISVNGYPVEITKETLIKTCQVLADNIADQAIEVVENKTRANNAAAFLQYCSDQYLEYQSGRFYPGLWFWQKAYFVQTGKSISLL